MVEFLKAYYKGYFNSYSGASPEGRLGVTKA